MPDFNHVSIPEVRVALETRDPSLIERAFYATQAAWFDDCNPGPHPAPEAFDVRQQAILDMLDAPDGMDANPDPEAFWAALERYWTN